MIEFLEGLVQELRGKIEALGFEMEIRLEPCPGDNLSRHLVAIEKGKEIFSVHFWGPEVPDTREVREKYVEAFNIMPEFLRSERLKVFGGIVLVIWEESEQYGPFQSLVGPYLN